MSAALTSDQDVRDALDRISSSEEFRASPNLTAFLRFIVERTLDGRDDTIKAYTVATEVLGRPESFDPQIDPIVRVEATRLRRNLERYYARTGDTLQITIPRGSYVPRFDRVDPADAATVGQGRGEDEGGPPQRSSAGTAPKPARQASRSGLATLRLGIGGVLLVLVGAALSWLMSPMLRGATPEKAAREQPMPSLSALTTGDAQLGPGRTRPALSLTAFGTVLVAPIQGTSSGAAVHAAMVGDLIRDALARFEDIVVVEVAGEQPSALPAPSEDTYLLTGRLTRQGPSSKVSLRLRHEVSQQIVWSADYVLAVGDGPGLSEAAMLRRITTAIASPAGVIAGDIAAAKKRADPLTVPAACLMEAGAFLDPARPDHGDLVETCLQRTVTDYPRLASGWAVLARTTLERFRMGGGADDARLDQALSQATTAVSLAPQSARAHQVLSDVLAARGDVRGAHQAIERALELNPNSVEVLQSAAFRRIEAGDYTTGLARLNEVAEAGAPLSPWRSLFVAIALAGMPGNLERLALVQDPSSHPASLLSTMIAKGATAQADSGRSAASRLVQLFPAIAGDPAAFLRRLGLREMAAQAVHNSLAAATLTASRS